MRPVDSIAALGRARTAASPASRLLRGLACAAALGAGAARAAEGVPAALVDDLVAANHILADQGVVDGFGHVSVRHPGDPNRFLMSRSLAPALVKPDDIMEFDLDGNALDARGRAVFLERFIHGEIYRARGDVQAVVHSHSPAVIPFGITGAPLRAAYHIAAFLAGGVPVFDIRQAAGATDMLVRDPALGRALAATLGAGPVALMRGHGDVVVGSTIPMAVFRAVYTEVNARVQGQAMALGGPVTYLDAAESEKADKALDQIHLRAWDLWKRKAAEAR
ncbi:3-hydroxy-2-methylpyridine-4,5-dicarboxylate 4-decarboxylase [Methylobacterium crusticola]|uniref:3-hydroxy-2-methylpyridine-4,5-dicarboxylate 4-decarboxylase n=1 Tax=Methylobacterium crusticola TaxID=1697972 RepID=A0ABQ4R8T4_9HYPH|nr:class II aldolase/adducin family protein [Methylobacterium crusticola]GJD53741.1 3-hydroxy-2-methylpyridine-4,5-dicarboxylate 4-decarboxylase [Methylobacterium crusticola]